MFSQIFSFSVLIFWDLDILKFWCFLNLLRFLSLLSFLILAWFWDFPSSAINANRVIPDKVLWVAWEDSSNWVAWAPDLEFIAGHCSLDCTLYTTCLLYSVKSGSSECRDWNIELWPKIYSEWQGHSPCSLQCCTLTVLSRAGGARLTARATVCGCTPPVNAAITLTYTASSFLLRPLVKPKTGPCMSW